MQRHESTVNFENLIRDLAEIYSPRSGCPNLAQGN